MAIPIQDDASLDNFDFGASSGHEIDAADEASDESAELGVAAALQSIQEQLSELRQLVKRNIDNGSWPQMNDL